MLSAQLQAPSAMALISSGYISKARISMDPGHNWSSAFPQAWQHFLLDNDAQYSLERGTYLKQIHDKEEEQQERWSNDQAVEQKPLDHCKGDSWWDQLFQVQVEIVTEWPCEQEADKPKGHGWTSSSFSFSLQAIPILSI